MTEEEFLKIVCQVRNIPELSLRNKPLDRASFDSLDLLELRAALEIRLDLPLTDEKFNSASTLEDLYKLVNQ